MANYFNEKAVYDNLLPILNEELKKAAQPIMERALTEMEKEMKKKLGSFVIAFLEKSFTVEKFQEQIIIKVIKEIDNGRTKEIDY